MVKLDKVDMQILKLLQEDGRLNNAEIAKRVFLSPPACWKRLKFLEQEVIKSGFYRTEKPWIQFLCIHEYYIRSSFRGVHAIF